MQTERQAATNPLKATIAIYKYYIVQKLALISIPWRVEG